MAMKYRRSSLQSRCKLEESDRARKRADVRTDLAIKPSDDNQGHLHEWKAQIVEGNDERLPGTLGMNSLESNRAIIDAGNGRLIHPGPGEVKVILPQGSIEMPIVKSPSGHPCILVDEYAEVLAKPPGGVTEPIPTLTVKKATAVTPPPVREPLSSMIRKYEKPRGLTVLVVEDQPIASAAVAEKGDAVERRSHADMSDAEDQHMHGEIRISRFSAVVTPLPTPFKTVPRRIAAQCPKMLATWFCTAAITGTVAFLLVAAWTEDGKAIASTNQVCHGGDTYCPDNILPSAGSCSVHRTKDVGWHAGSCEKNIEHCKNDDDFRDKPYAAERRLNTNMIGHLFNHTRSLWSTYEGSGRRHVYFDKDQWNKETREAFPLPSELLALPTDVVQSTYPTDSAVRAKERQMANKRAGIKPKKKPKQVENHDDYEGFSLSCPAIQW